MPDMTSLATSGLHLSKDEKRPQMPPPTAMGRILVAWRGVLLCPTYWRVLKEYNIDNWLTEVIRSLYDEATCERCVTKWKYRRRQWEYGILLEKIMQKALAPRYPLVNDHFAIAVCWWHRSAGYGMEIDYDKTTFSSTASSQDHQPT